MLPLYKTTTKGENKMPKIKQTLKSQLTLRIYNQEDKDILDKAYNRTKSGFDNLSDFIRYCTVTGAEKLLGDNEVDQRANLDEIRQSLIEIHNEISYIKCDNKQNKSEHKTDIALIKKMLNYIACIVYNLECNKKCDYDINEGLFDLLDEELNCIRETNGR